MTLILLETILLECIVTAVLSVCIKKDNLKLLNFCVAILILKMKENKRHFWYAMLYYIKKCKNTTETHTLTRFVQYMEKVL